MDPCTIEIKTQNDGKTSVFREKATFSRTEDGESVTYPVEGDEGELFFSESGIEMRRRGKNTIFVKFREGKETELRLQEANNVGSIPVLTTCYRLKKERDGRRIELKYNLLGSEPDNSFYLQIYIKFFSEEK